MKAKRVYIFARCYCCGDKFKPWDEGDKMYEVSGATFANAERAEASPIYIEPYCWDTFQHGGYIDDHYFEGVGEIAAEGDG